MSRGRVEIILHDSKVLADNPLGDPTLREIGVYLPPGYDEGTRRYPVVTILAGFTGTGLGLVARSAWQQPLDRRLDALIERGMPPCIVVLPDCFTRYGGSQYVDSPAIGRYASYVVELVAFVDSRFRTIADRTARAIAGKSSGGYGALHLAATRSDVFSAVASHAGDLAFDTSLRAELPKTAIAIGRDGGLARFLARFDASASKSGADIEPMSIVCCAAAWSYDATGPYGFGTGFQLPFDLDTASIRGDVWARWLAADLCERDLAPLRSMSTIFIDAGRGDEYALQFGARTLSRRLTSLGLAHVHEEFDGGHRNTSHRYDRSLPLLVGALATS